MKKLTWWDKMNFYQKRKRKEDIEYLHITTGYSKSHIYNMLNYNRMASNKFVDNLYLISFRRKRNEDLIKNIIKNA